MIDDYEGDTFIAYLDISGFKVLMKNESRALTALDRFYSSAYRALQNQNNSENFRVEGFFVSDCGVLFIREKSNNDSDQVKQFSQLLETVKNINFRMIQENFMLMTSISYGRFKYERRIEFPGINKDPIFGNAYVSAFLDNENGSPRIQPGQCRIIKNNLPEIILNAIKNHRPLDPFNNIKKRKKNTKHFYYYWMLNNRNDINEFEEAYKDTYNLKYAGMLETIKNYSNKI